MEIILKQTIRKLKLAMIESDSTINLDENEVIYRAEGNANIVLSLYHMRKVVRIRKSLIKCIESEGKFYVIY